MFSWSGKRNNSNDLIVNIASQAQLLRDLEDQLAQRQGFAVATLNLDHLVKLRRDPQFEAAYRQHSHITADGNPIVWLSRLAGRQIGLVTGSDLVLPVVQAAARQDVHVTLFGATPQALDKSAEALSRAVPGLTFAAKIAPPMGFDPASEQADQAIAQIGKAGGRLCLLALGAPKQEVFAARAAAALPDTGFVSIGAGLDFLAGTQRRAPKLVRMFAAEWLWRMLGNPGRLARRYAECFAILPGEAMRAISQRGNGAETGPDSERSS